MKKFGNVRKNLGRGYQQDEYLLELLVHLVFIFPTVSYFARDTNKQAILFFGFT